MNVSENEIKHIAKLANLNLGEEETKKYLNSLQDILNFVEVINKAPVEGLDETVGTNQNCNVFRKDEVKTFEDTEALLQNAPEQERGMFKIPKVL